MVRLWLMLLPVCMRILTTIGFVMKKPLYYQQQEQQQQQPADGIRAGRVHLCRVAGNTVWLATSRSSVMGIPLRALRAFSLFPVQLFCETQCRGVIESRCAGLIDRLID